MDDLLESNKNKRFDYYKYRSIVNDQESRRFELLENQRRKRENALNSIRKVCDVFPEFGDEETIGNDENHSDPELMDWTDTKPRIPRLRDMFMFSEWMVKLPENFEEKWLFVLCPVGKRCLVKSSKGFTTVYGKGGKQKVKFQSALPNGGPIDFEKMSYSNSDVTILDCIWNPQVKTYYILDLLSWKGQFYMDTETNFRVFWIKSKVEEMPWLSARSDKNPYPFISLDFFPCNIDSLSTIFSRFPYFLSDSPSIDGALFYHSEAFYTPGSTPLVVWLKPFMVPEVLGIEIAESYHNLKPSDYSDMNKFISDFERSRQLKKERRCAKYRNKQFSKENKTHEQM